MEEDHLLPQRTGTSGFSCLIGQRSCLLWFTIISLTLYLLDIYGFKYFVVDNFCDIFFFVRTARKPLLPATMRYVFINHRNILVNTWTWLTAEYLCVSSWRKSLPVPRRLNREDMRDSKVVIVAFRFLSYNLCLSCIWSYSNCRILVFFFWSIYVFIIIFYFLLG